MKVKQINTPLSFLKIIAMAWFRSLDNLEVEQRRLAASAERNGGKPGVIAQCHYKRAKKESDQIWELYQEAQKTKNLQVILNRCPVREIETQLMLNFKEVDK